MDPFGAPVTDVRPLLSNERQDLVRLLRALSPQEWTMPSAVPGWSVKDLALHLLEWSGQPMDTFYASLDLLGEGHVSWASDGPVPGMASGQRWIRTVVARGVHGHGAGRRGPVHDHTAWRWLTGAALPSENVYLTVPQSCAGLYWACEA
jgi:hypothetical protein